MRHIQHHLALLGRRRRWQHLETARPVGLANSLLHLLRRHVEPELRQFFRSSDRQGQVAQLMPSGQRRVHVDFFAHYGKRITATAALGQGASFKIGLSARRHRRNILHGAHASGMLLQDGLADHVVRLGMLRQRDHNAVLPDDAGLLARDFGKGIAEILLMIERDIGDD